jgi:hypothetical protein
MIPETLLLSPELFGGYEYRNPEHGFARGNAIDHHLTI